MHTYMHTDMHTYIQARTLNVYMACSCPKACPGHGASLGQVRYVLLRFSQVCPVLDSSVRYTCIKHQALRRSSSIFCAWEPGTQHTDVGVSFSHQFSPRSRIVQATFTYAAQRLVQDCMQLRSCMCCSEQPA